MYPRFILFCLWFIIAIPFIPQLLPGSDNQPTFSFFAFIFLVLSSKSFSKKGLIIVTLLVFAFIIAYFYSNLFLGINFQSARVFAFIQFLLAIQLGSSKYFYLPEKWFYYFIRIYAFFTIIYFITGGYIEDRFILSRLSSSEDLILSGRGARTLSPEPAIMSIQLLNIFVLHNLFYKKYRLNLISFVLLIISLLGSLSGYGFSIALLILFFFNPIIFLIIAFISSFSIYILSSSLNLGNSRIAILLSNLNEDGIRFFLNDASFLTRLTSFQEYTDSFIKTFPFGDAFTIVNGGGFVSIISALGIFGFIFFLIYFILITLPKYDIKLKILLLSWTMIHFLSGSFGVPLVGIIIGKFINDKIKYE